MFSQLSFPVIAASLLCIATLNTSIVPSQAFSTPQLQRCLIAKRFAIRNTSRRPSHLHLFQSILQKPNPSDTGSKVPDATPKCRIPEAELNILNTGFGVGNIPPFPYSMDLIPKNAGDTISSPATKIIVRHLEEDDIPRILPEVVREFGSLLSSPQSNEPGDEFSTQIENYLFSLTVLIGLTQRVKRRIKGYPSGITSNSTPDHNVICIVEQIPIISKDTGETISYSEQIVGIGEISWQPPNPSRNAPPFVLPYFVKQIIAQFSAVVDEDGVVLDAPRGYISNVLVYKNRRGLGYGRVLMAALEGIAKMWGCEDVSLHVDADEKSGRVAQGLYRKLGYVGVPDTGSFKSKGSRVSVGYEWMGPSMANQGLYMVDGIPLVYMRKKFVEER